MVIQHNLAALNSHRQMGVNNKNTSKNLEKLSSGYKVNRAGDDAAGLAISEKMRGQIRGLAMAEQNVTAGISLIQTAEGGLNETHAILQRMRELAVQSSNGTYDPNVDRAQIEKEFQAIKSEIDRISQSTAYNGINLLDGSLSGGSKLAVAKFDIPKGIDDTATLTEVVEATKGSFAGAAVAAVASAANVAFKSELSVTYVGTDGNEQTVTVAIDDVAGKKDFSTAAKLGDEYLKLLKQTELNDMFEMSNAAGVITFKAKEAGFTKQPTISTMGERITQDVATLTPGVAFTSMAVTATKGADAYQTLDLSKFDSKDASKNSFSLNGTTFQFVTASELAGLDKSVVGLLVAAAGAPATADVKSAMELIKQHTGLDIKLNGTVKLDVFGATSGNGNGGLTFQIGANGSKDQRVTLSVDNMNAASIGVGTASVLTQDAANKAIDMITAATNKVSGTRADLGALQNRLEHTMNNLGVTKENLTAAESSIRDVDMAKEMMEFTKNNILVQASQAMLAQANQLPQGVLQLLR